MEIGRKTSEFIITVLTIVAAVVLVIVGEADASTVLPIIAGETGIYTAARTYRKVKGNQSEQDKTDNLPVV